MPTYLLDGLSPAQAEAVTTDAAPLAVVAGPGSGKTRVLTRRVAWRVTGGHADAAHVLVLTFSRRAANELFGRLARLGLAVGAREAGVVAGTFHAIAYAELTRHRAERGQAALSVAGRPARLIRPELAKVIGRDLGPAGAMAVAAELSWARAHGGGPGSYERLAREADRRPSVAPSAIAATWGAYEVAKQRRRVLDLDDMLERCTRLLETDEEASRAARWRHRHFFVDEYQDLNPAHRRLLRAWVGDRADLCLVGDPDQAVYGFNGASPDLFDRVADDWPGVRSLRLSDNFRSTPEVVALANAVRPGPSLSTVEEYEGATGGADRTEGSERWQAATISRQATTISRQPSGPLPLLSIHADDQAEARAVAVAIASRRVPGRSWGGMAVLARTNARLRLVASALDRVDIPWRLRDARPLAERPCVEGWLSLLPPTAAASELAEIILDEPDHLDAHAMDAALREFLDVAPAASVSAFARWLDATGVTAPDPPGAGIDLVTFHRAKGLEWRAVWVIGVEEGLVPLGRRSDEASLAEEQRLLYVALTRAADDLAVSWAARRINARDELVPCRPSRWVEHLSGAWTTMAATPSREEQCARLSELRRRLVHPAPPVLEDGHGPLAAPGQRTG